MQEVLQNLDSQSAEKRRLAIEQLALTNVTEIFAIRIAGLIADKDRGVRDAASQILIEFPSEKVAEEVVKHIVSKKTIVRNLAGDTLVKMGKVAVAAVKKYVTHTDKDVRKFAIDVLALLPAYDCVEVIADALSDKDQNVVLSAIDALAALNGDFFAPQLINIYENCEFARANVISALAVFEGDYEDFFSKSLVDKDPVVQLLSLEALCSKAEQTAFKVLLTHIESVNEFVRPLLLKEIVQISEKNDELRKKIPSFVKKYFIKMLDDSDEELVLYAIRGLAFFNDVNAVEKLIEKMGTSEELDMEIYQTLGRMPFNVIMPILNAADEQISPQTAARFSLALLGKYLQTDEKVAEDVSCKAIANFITQHFYYLEVDAKLMAIQLFMSFKLPLKDDVLTAAAADDEAIIANAAKAYV